MSRRDEFITVINTFKTVSPTITDEQRIGLLRQAVQNYGLSTEEASEVLNALGLIVGENVPCITRWFLDEYTTLRACCSPFQVHTFALD